MPEDPTLISFSVSFCWPQIRRPVGLSETNTKFNYPATADRGVPGLPPDLLNSNFRGCQSSSCCLLEAVTATAAARHTRLIKGHRTRSQQSAWSVTVVDRQ